jgi:hypothetical protein
VSDRDHARLREELQGAREESARLQAKVVDDALTIAALDPETRDRPS